MADLKLLIQKLCYERIRWPEDIKYLRTYAPELQGLTDHEIQTLYETFSAHQFSAGWLYLDQSSLDEFRSWLLSAAEAARE